MSVRPVHIVHTEVASVYAGSTEVLLAHLLQCSPSRWKHTILFRHAAPREEFARRIPPDQRGRISVPELLESDVTGSGRASGASVGPPLRPVAKSPKKTSADGLRLLAGAARYYITTVLPNSRHFANWLRGQGVDLLQLHNGPLGNVHGILAASRVGLPLTGRLQSFMEPSILDRPFLNRPAGYIAVAEAVKEFYVKRGIDASRIHTVHEGLREEEFEPPDGWESVRGELGVPESHVLIGLVGRLVWWKGHDYFLEAAEIVRRSHRDVSFVIVGGADPTEPEYEAHLHRKAQCLGLADCVHFTGYRPDARRYTAALDIAVLASCLPEPGGRSVLEALALGKACIATRAGGMPEYVGEDESAGLLVPMADPVAMAEAMNRLVEDRDTARKLGETARVRMHTKFHMRQTVEGIERFWSDILQGAGTIRQ